MADFKEGMKILMGLEFNSPSNALHKNSTEDGYTYMGIYQKYNSDWVGWIVVQSVLKKVNDIKEASKILYKNDILTRLVYLFYKKKFWDVARLDELKSQHIANEIFIFGVNAGMRRAVKFAQQLAGVSIDGFIGPVSIKALDECDIDKFDREYDLLEQKYYEDVIKRDSRKKIYANGWRDRSVAV